VNACRVPEVQALGVGGNCLFRRKWSTILSRMRLTVLILPETRGSLWLLKTWPSMKTLIFAAKPQYVLLQSIRASYEHPCIILLVSILPWSQPSDTLASMFMPTVGCRSRISRARRCLVIASTTVAAWYDTVRNLTAGSLAVVNLFAAACGHGLMIGDM
jgi:hypothetical protein